jgi:CheY-like chemotaxis protein
MDPMNLRNDSSFSPDDVTTWKVLLVDDEPDNLTIGEMMLKYAGATVYTAQNGAEGLALLADLTPSFILLDLSMPFMDGWDMLKVIRHDERWRDLPVIAFTAHVMPGDKADVFDAGFDGYLPKPFRMKTFVTDIQKCLHHIEREPSNEGTVG